MRAAKPCVTGTTYMQSRCFVELDDTRAEWHAFSRSGSLAIALGAGFGPDDDGHYAYLDTEARLGVTLELIERPKRRQPPEKVYPEPAKND